ncbi:hypothetical protein [Micromonospora sp. NPDC047740]|uniref:hypothetical protein n=1 Tax=Micromonospora sp. NPDC047740 TaxID=3364254 RepID=UPI003713A10F
MAEHYLGLLEFAAQPRHQPPRLHVQPFQVRVRHRRLLWQAAAGYGLRVGERRLVRLLLLELGRVLVVERLEFGPGAADGAGGGGERVVVRGGGVVGALHLVDELVQLAEVRARGGVGVRRPCLGEAATVFLQPPEVGQGEVADLAPTGDLLPLPAGVLVL